MLQLPCHVMVTFGASQDLTLILGSLYKMEHKLK